MSRSPRLLALVAALVLPCIGRAVIVYGGDGTQNTTAPANGAPWNRVGVVNGASGVYLGSYAGKDWVLTADHVGLGSFRLGGVAYSAINGSALQLTNANGTGTDLLLYQINTSLDWSLLPITGSPLALGTSVTMIGNGRNRAVSPTTGYIGSVNDKPTWLGTTPVAGATEVESYPWASGNAMRWGTNTVAGDVLAEYNNGVKVRTTACAYTAFDASLGEAQGASGDSGGGVFSQSAGGAWSVSGIMVYIDSYTGQPGGTAVTGNHTYYADLSAYRGQILTAIPEPATVSLWTGLGALGLAVWWRRRR